MLMLLAYTNIDIAGSCLIVSLPTGIGDGWADVCGLHCSCVLSTRADSNFPSGTYACRYPNNFKSLCTMFLCIYYE